MADFAHMSAAGRKAALRAQKRQAKAAREARPIGLRAQNEDDDGYDPYSDYMDALARESHEEPQADPWR